MALPSCFFIEWVRAKGFSKLFGPSDIKTRERRRTKFIGDEKIGPGEFEKGAFICSPSNGIS
jgi:hypothetical protein